MVKEVRLTACPPIITALVWARARRTGWISSRLRGGFIRRATVLPGRKTQSAKRAEGHGFFPGLLRLFRKRLPWHRHAGVRPSAGSVRWGCKAVFASFVLCSAYTQTITSGQNLLSASRLLNNSLGSFRTAGGAVASITRIGQAGCLAMIFLERSSPLPARIRRDWEKVLAASLPAPNGKPCE